MHKLIGVVPLFFLLALPLTARADSDDPMQNLGAHKEDRPRYVKSVVYGGASFSGKTDYTVGLPTGGASKSSDQASSYPLLGVEVTYQSNFPIGLGLIIEGTRYEYADSAGSDGQLGFYILPRLAHTVGPFEFWAGVGLGIMITNIGGPSSVTEDGLTINLSNMSPAAFAWTPRAGLDINLGTSLFFGGQFAYTSTTFSEPFTGNYGGDSITGSESISRSWLSFAIRFGRRL